MAILDELAEFCDATALDTTGTGLDLLGDQYDLGSGTVQDLGDGKPLYLVIQVTAAFTTGSTSKVSFKLASDAAAAMTVATASVHAETPLLDTSSWTVGKTIVMPLPSGDLVPYERYLGIIQNTETAAVTGGAINAFLSLDPVTPFVAPADAVN